MTSPIKTAALLLVMASMALPAMARADDDRGWDRGRGHNGYDNRHDRREERRDDRRDRRESYRDGYRDGYRNDRRDDRRYATPVYRGGYYRAPPVVYRAPARSYYWQRGSRYYDRGYGPTYVVTDYRPYGLRAPPRGYGWRRSDAGDFLLVAAATGIITDLVLHGGR